MNATGDKKDRILLAALDIFSDRPFHMVKIEEIAEKAGVGKGTIYEYFKSKEELFASMLQAASRQYFIDLAGTVRQGKNAREKLKHIFTYHLHFIGKHVNMARVLLAERRLLQEGLCGDLKNSRAAVERFITALLQEGIDNGEFRSLDSVLTAQVILGTLSALWGYILFQGHTVAEPEEVAEKLLDFYLLGLEKRTA